MSVTFNPTGEPAQPVLCGPRGKVNTEVQVGALHLQHSAPVSSLVLRGVDALVQSSVVDALFKQ